MCSILKCNITATAMKTKSKTNQFHKNFYLQKDKITLPQIVKDR